MGLEGSNCAHSSLFQVGLMSQGESLSYAFAYSLYLREVDDEWHTSFAKFKEEANPMNINIDFVGVWYGV